MGVRLQQIWKWKCIPPASGVLLFTKNFKIAYALCYCCIPQNLTALFCLTCTGCGEWCLRLLLACWCSPSRWDSCGDRILYRRKFASGCLAVLSLPRKVNSSGREHEEYLYAPCQICRKETTIYIKTFCQYIQYMPPARREAFQARVQGYWNSGIFLREEPTTTGEFL